MRPIACLPKDFIETEEGLIFAVVSAAEEDGRVLAFLRYQRTSNGWEKLASREANALLHDCWPDYLYYSKARDVHLHAVPREKISCHHQPQRRLIELCKQQTDDAIERKVRQLLRHFGQQGLRPQAMGITGSVLIGAHTPQSDIDLVVYRHDAFFKAREIIKQLLCEGVLHDLDDRLWHDAYARRGCSLSFDEFLWHERRKYNKAAIQQTKFDLSLLALERRPRPSRYIKQGKVFLESRVTDHSHCFDYPARYGLEHPSIREVVSYTATYAGQAFKGETVAIQGQLEVSAEGRQRILIGTDREASGEYLKVLSAK